MARTATLLELRTQARQRADMVGSNFVSDTELTGYINSSAAELYDLLIAQFEDYKVTSGNISVVPSTSSYSLPTDFYKLLGVDLVVDSQGNAVTLKPFVFAERNAYMFTPTWNVVGLAYLRYHMIGDSIRFVPVPNQTQTVKLWYIPALTKLSADADTLDGVNGWEEYVVVDAAIKMLAKEESSTEVFQKQKKELIDRINKMAANRDPGSPTRVTDGTKRLPWEFWSFGEGT
jgi:hypothetical protein